MAETMRFGRYLQQASDGEPMEWLVLARWDDRLLLLARECPAVESWHFRATDTPWRNCNLRAWLHEVFLPRAFTEEEARQILRPAHGGAASACPEDRVFILSAEEMVRFFPTRRERVVYASPAADRLLSLRGYVHPDRTCSWWLRVDGWCRFRQPVVNRGGLITDYSCNDAGTCVRPALWLRTDTGA